MPGGIICIRDYGVYDMTMMRFIRKNKSQNEDKIYKRGDGTLTYYFTSGIYYLYY